MEGKIRLAVFGQKRLSREGGVEIVVKELCTRMAQNGCEITCYNRAGHHVSGAEYDKAMEYDGIRQKVVPTIEKKGARDIIGQPEKSLISCGFTRLDLFTSTCFCLSWCVITSVILGANGFWLRSILNPPQRKLIEQKTK